MRKLLPLLLLWFSSSYLLAQDQCAFILEEAQDMFDAGIIEEIPEKLASCLNSGFTKEEKLQAYKLIILAHLYDDNVVVAEEVMLSFLKEYPAYEVVATDPQEFISMLESFDREPVLMIGGSFGPNFTFPAISTTLGAYNYESYSGSYVPGGAGIQSSLRIERNLKKGFSLLGELAFMSYRYDFYLDSEPEEGVFNAEITDWTKIEYYEAQNILKFPLGLSYRVRTGKLNSYILAGISPGVLLYATADGFREYLNTGDTKLDDISVANVQLQSLRPRFNLSAYGGFGMRYPIGPGDFFLEARFATDLHDQFKVNADKFQPQLATKIFYVPDEIILSNLAVSAGYVFPIFNPKKKVE